MCYETSQLAEKIYREALRVGAPAEEINRLKLKWEKLKAEHGNYYHASGFLHPKLALLTSRQEQIDIKLCVWGLIPNWTKDQSFAHQIWNRTINARGETIFNKPSFKLASQKDRCILPLDGFFEHHHKNGKTYPYFIRSTNKKRMLLGAIKDSWIDKSTGEIIDSFSIVTTPGNELLSSIHNNPKLDGPRMPFILNESDTNKWLNGTVEEAKKLIKSNTSIDLEAYTVQKLKGKNYMGNHPEVQRKHDYFDRNEPPNLFDD